MQTSAIHLFLELSLLDYLCLTARPSIDSARSRLSLTATAMMCILVLVIIRFQLFDGTPSLVGATLMRLNDTKLALLVSLTA